MNNISYEKNDGNKLYLTLKQVESEYGIKVHFLKKIIKNSELKAFQISDRKILLQREDIENYIQSKKV
jgi:hypothetical protein